MVDDTIKLKGVVLRDDKLIRKEMLIGFDEWQGAGREFAMKFM
jgi:hydroxymethylbilane synthase